MLSRSRTWVLDLFGIRDQRNRKLPTAGYSISIGYSAFDPSSVNVYTDINAFQTISPVFVISGNTQPVQLCWRQLSGKGITPVAYRKNGGSWTTVASGVTFGVTFAENDTVQLAYNPFATTPASGILLRMENVTDTYANWTSTLTLSTSTGGTIPP